VGTPVLSLVACAKQVQLEDMYTGPQLLLNERYAALLVVFFVCVIFSAGVPVRSLEAAVLIR